MKKHIGFILGLLSLMLVLSTGQAGAQLVMTNNYFVVLDGGTPSKPTTLVITNPATSGITNAGTGWIISENEFNQVDWNIGTHTGSYIVPFGSTSEYLPVTCNITSTGTGNGSIRFSTYPGSTWDNLTYEPSDVTDMTDFGATNYSNNAVDRFWILDAQGYSTKPTPDITLTYIRSGAASEIAPPNYIREKTLIAQRFNSTSDEWYDWFGITGTDVTSGNTGSVESGTVPPTDFYRSWCVFNDSNTIQGVADIDNSISSFVVAFPNPTNGSFTVSGLTRGQAIELYDYLGQRLTSAFVDNATMYFDISTRANGLYLVRILNSDGSLAAEKKILKTR